MFKLFYKAFLISIMSGSLLTMNTIAYAQNTSATANMSSTGYTRGADGVLQKKETVHFDKTNDDDDNALLVITGLAAGFLGMKVMMYEKKTTDMTLVAAASLMYVAAEVLNVLNLKKQIDEKNIEITKREDGKNDQAQIDTLNDLKASYEDVKKSSETKLMLLRGAEYAYIGAFVVAVWQRFTLDGQYASCESALVSGEGTLVSCIAAGAVAAVTVVAANEAKACAACKIPISALTLEVPKRKADAELANGVLASIAIQSKDAVSNAYILSSEKSGQGLCSTGGTARGVIAAVAGACETYVVNQNLATGFGVLGIKDAQNHPAGIENLFYANIEKANMSIDPTLTFGNLIKKMSELILPKAEAGMIDLLGLAAGALTAFLTTSNALGRTVDTYMFTPGGRMIAWTIMSAAVMTAADATEKEIKKLDDRIKSIDQTIADLNTLKAGVKAANVTNQQVQLARLQAIQEQSIQINSDASVKTDCLTSMGSEGCSSLASQIRGMPGFANLPDSFQTIGTQSASAADGLSGTNTISGSTLTTIGQMGNGLNAVRKLAETMKDKLNNQRVKNGQAKIDFNKESNALLGKLKTQAAIALKEKGMSASGMLASMGMSPINNAKAAIAKATATGAKNTSGTAGAASTKEKEKGLDLDFKEVAAVGGAQGADGKPAKEDKYDIGTNDINTSSGESIFKIISNRYIKSGYHRLLEEIPTKK